MMPATSGPSLASKAARSTRPRSLAGIESTSKPQAAAVAGLVPWADSGTRMRRRCSPRCSRAARIAITPQSSPWAPAAGDMATAGMPVRVFSQWATRSMSSSAPCTVEIGLHRMEIGQARQPRHLLVEPRVVLHGAGAQRIEPHVDGVVLLAEAGVVADHLGLGQARQADGRPCAAARPAGRDGAAAPGRSTPQRPASPCSKISGSSIIRPRLPVKVGGRGSQP